MSRLPDGLRRWGRLLLVVVTALLVQLSLVSGLPVWGAVGDVLLVVVVAVALADPDRAAQYGFVIGLAYDLLLGSPFGLSALVYALIGFGVGRVAAWLADPNRWTQVLVAVFAGVAAMLTMVGVALLLGLSYSVSEVATIVAVVGLWNAVLIVPAIGVAGWVVGRGDGDDFWVALP